MSKRRKMWVVGAVVCSSFLLDSAALRASAHAHMLSNVRSWAYQLQAVDIETLAKSACDLVVIDYSRDGSDREAFTAEQISAIRKKPDGSDRIVLSYLSIGEAEDYRFYWDKGWTIRPPRWLGAENAEWPGNFAVNYWDPDWQKLIFGQPSSFLDRIAAAGFDGVYLDKVDAFYGKNIALGLTERMGAMAAFVHTLADYARGQRPGFAIVAQNGEELLSLPAFADTLDGFAKEDLLYGIEGDEIRNADADVEVSHELIAGVLNSGRPVLVAEYLSTHELIAEARAEIQALGALPFIGSRELEKPTTC